MKSSFNCTSHCWCGSLRGLPDTLAGGSARSTSLGTGQQKGSQSSADEGCGSTRREPEHSTGVRDLLCDSWAEGGGKQDISIVWVFVFCTCTDTVTYGAAGHGFSCSPALCARAAVTQWPPRPRGGRAPSFQGFHISQSKFPKQGTKWDTNVACPSCPPSCEHCEGQSCSPGAGLGQLSQDNLPLQQLELILWTDVCSSCWKSVPNTSLYLPTVELPFFTRNCLSPAAPDFMRP